MEKIKSSKDRNELKGAIFEIIVAGGYYNEGHSVLEFPTNPNNPVYDLKLIQNEFNIYISIKIMAYLVVLRNFSRNPK